jgi:hypothetical protein
MDALLIGYARVSTDEQDLTAQREALAALGVSAERTYVDQGLTGTNRQRPGLRQALAACRAGDTLVVTKLDRLARSLPDARGIIEDITRRRSSSTWTAPSTTPPTRSAGCCSTCWPWWPSSKGDLIRAREHSVAELGDLFGITRSTVYGAIERDAARQRTALPGRTPLGGTLS